MKLIIDISDNAYEGVKTLIAINFGGRFSGKGLVHDSFKAIKNGVPLDNIKAEIEKLDEGITSYHNDKPWVYKSEVLGILDSIGEGARNESTCM